MLWPRGRGERPLPKAGNRSVRGALAGAFLPARRAGRSLLVLPLGGRRRLTARTLNLDPPRTALLGALRHGDGQHAVVEGRFHLIRIGLEGQTEGALEAAIAALHEMVVGLLVTLLLLELLLATDGELIVLQRNVDILLVDARQLHTDAHFLVGFGDVHAGIEGGRRAAALARGRREAARAAEDIVEQAGHLALN